MSALAHLADSSRASGEVREVPQADFPRSSKQTLLDHLVGAPEQRKWNGEAEQFGSLQIDDQLNLG